MSPTCFKSLANTTTENGLRPWSVQKSTKSTPFSPVSTCTTFPITQRCLPTYFSASEKGTQVGLPASAEDGSTITTRNAKGRNLAHSCREVRCIRTLDFYSRCEGNGSDRIRKEFFLRLPATGSTRDAMKRGQTGRGQLS